MFSDVGHLLRHLYFALKLLRYSQQHSNFSSPLQHCFYAGLRQITSLSVDAECALMESVAWSI